MTRKLLPTVLAAVAVLFSFQLSYAQEPTPVVGDFGSVASGKWSSLSTWKQWDGTGWNTTPTGGPGSSKQVFILTGTTVTYDAASQNCKNLIVESGATFKSDSTLPCPSGSLMPLKINGTTVWVAGNLGGGPNDALVLETRHDGTVTLEGGGKVNLAQVRPNSGQSGTMAFVFGTNANINYAGVDSTGGAGIYTQRGSQTSSTITINAGDTVTFAANSNFMINSSPGLNGTMNTTLNVDGVVNDSGTVVLADTNAAAALNIGTTGMLIVRGGSIVQSLNGADTATVTVDGTYEHAMDGGVIPTATWNTGSTCLVTGTTTQGPTNANQNFYDLTIDCPNLAAPSYPCHFDMASNTIAGNVTFENTNGNYFALTGYEVPVSPKTITVNGNFTIGNSSDFVAIDDYSKSHGKGNTILTVKGNFNSKGSFGLSVGSSKSNNNVVLLGDLTLQGGSSFFSHSSTTDSVFFAGTTVQKYTASGLANNNWISSCVRSGATVDMDTSTFSGSSSSFEVEAGGTLKTADVLGLDGNIKVGGTKIVSVGAGFDFDGAAPQVTGALMPDTVGNLTVTNKAGVTPDTALTVNGTLLINGLLINKYGITANGSSVVNGTYEHAMNGGLIPKATWNSGSTCLITGLTTSNLTGANQNFYNFVVNCDSLTQPSIPIHFDMKDNIIGGDLTIYSTNGKYLALTGFDTPSPKNITVNGNFSVDSTSGFFAVDDYSSSHPVESVKLTVKGNMSIAGSFGLTVGSARNLINLVLHGNLNLQTGSAFFSHSKTQDSLFFAGTGVQTYKAGALSNGNHVNTVVQTGSILDMGSSAFQGSSSSFAADSGSGLKTADTLGLDGNVAVGGGTRISGAASFEYNGALAQVTGALLPDTVKGLTINNGSGVLLSHPVEVTGGLTLAKGVLVLDTNNIVASSVTGGSAHAYLSTDSAVAFLMIGNVGSKAVIFPVGTQSDGYSPVWITNSGTADSFRVSAMSDTSLGAGGRVNVTWNISPAKPGSDDCTLQFGWMAAAEDTAFAANRTSDAKIYLLADTGNTEVGTGSYSTQFSSEPYAVSRSGVTSFGSFAVGNFNLTAVNEQHPVPAVFRLYQNYPNPFNPTTHIEFTVAKKGQTSLVVYNILGQKVATLFSADAQPGMKYAVDFNGGEFASGVYFSVLQSNGQRQIHKMVLMK